MNNSKRGHEVSRKLLSKIILSALDTNQITIKDLARTTAVGKSTIHNLKAGKWLSLSTLCQLVSSPLTSSILSPENATKILSRIIAESISEDHRHPVFQLISVPEDWALTNLPTLSEYMKDIRKNRLKLSKNKVETHLCCSYYRQITKIEKDCYGVGIGPICNLFYHYMQELNGSTDKEWNIFATLVLQKLFPRITGYWVEVTGWQEMQR